MATLKLRRGSSFTSPQLGEPFYNTDSDTLQLGISGSQFVTFTKLDDINTGSLLLNGGISASGDITASNLRVENDIRLNGSIYLGDEEVDKIYISASLSGSLIPDSGGTFDLGNETETWRNLYVDTASIGQMELDGITVLDNLTVSGISSFQTVTELDGTLTEYSQSVQSRLSNLETDTGSQDGRLDNLELFTSSQESKNTTLENTTSSLEQATSSLESFTGSQEDLNVTFATTGSNVFSGSQTISGSILATGDVHEFTGSLFVSGAIRFDIPLGANSDIVESDLGNVRINPGFLRTTNATDEPFFTESTRRGGFHDFDSVFVSNKDTGYSTIGFSTNLSRSLDFPSVTLDGIPNEEPGFYASSGSDSFTYYTWLRIQRADEYTDGRVTFTTPIISSGSLTAPLQQGHYWVGDENGYNEQVPTSSFTDRIDTLETGSTSQVGRLDKLEIFTGSQETKNTTLESVTSSLELFTSSIDTTIKTKLDTDGVVSGSSQISFTGITDKPTLVSGSSQVVYTDLSSIPSGIVSGSSQVVYTDLSSIPSGIVSGSTQITDGSDLVSGSVLRPGGDGVISGSDQLTGSLVDLSSDQTISGTKTFNDIVVNGTGSFGQLESVSGTAKIIGDAFIILNNDTPTQRYAGIKVLDSGSSNTTASFQYDGEENNWFYQYTDDGGVTDEYGVTLFGPEYNDIDSPVYLTSGSIPKGDGGHHLYDSNISDDGTLITLGSNIQVNGNISLSGKVDGIDLQNFSSSVDGRLDTLEGTSNENPLTFTDTTTIDFTRTGDDITANVIGGIVSGSIQVKELLPPGTISGSSQLTTEFDTRYLNTNGDNVISSSAQLTTDFDSRYLNTNGDDVISGSSQIDIIETNGFTEFSESLYDTDASASLDIIEQNLRIIELEHTASFNSSSIVSLEQISSSHESRITNLESTGSDHESRIASSSDDISNLEISESLLDGRVSELETFSASLDTEFLNVGGDNVVSGSTGDQLTGSFDQRYAQSSSFQNVSSSYVNLVGDFSSDIQNGNINLGDGAFLNVSSSLTPSTPNEVLANAGAIRQYIDDSVGAADITAVIVEDGLSGGGTDGDVSMSLDTGSTHFTDGVLFSLPQGTISGSGQLDLLGYLNINGDDVFTSSQQVVITNVSGFSTFSSSVDTRLDDLESFSSSLDADFVTQAELTNATGALEDSISTKLDTGSYNTDSSSFDGRIDNLELFSSSIDTTIKTKLDTDGVVSGSSQISFTGITDKPTLVSGSTQITDGSDLVSGSVLRPGGDGVVSGSLQISFVGITDKPTLVSGSSQVVYTDLSSIPSGIVSGSTQITDGSDLVSGSVLRPNGDGVVSGSSQISFVGITDKPTLVSGSTQVVYTDLSSIPSGIVSGSTQITDGSDLVSGSVLRPGGDGIISGSDQLTGSLVDLSSDQTISGTKTFQDIVVNGTGSFGQLESVSGTAKIIGDAFIILNNSTPTQRFAGLSVIDSGSDPLNPTASFLYDGETGDFKYEYIESGSGGFTTESAVFLVGPETDDKINSVYPTQDYILKGLGDHHVSSSRISDDGVRVEIETSLNVVGDITGSSFTGNILSTNGVISGSSQVNADTITNFDSNVKTKLDLDGVHSGSSQIVQFGKVGIGTGSDATYELKVDGDIAATGDIVAYISSDRRLKENITRISDPIHKINQLSGYSFEWNEEKQNIYNGKDYGVVAQEVQEIFPELVTERESGYLGVKYDRLVSVLIEAVKELSNEVNELKSKLE